MTTPRAYEVTLRVGADDWPSVLRHLRAAYDSVKQEPEKQLNQLSYDGSGFRVVLVVKPKKEDEHG